MGAVIRARVCRAFNGPGGVRLPNGTLLEDVSGWKQWQRLSALGWIRVLPSPEADNVALDRAVRVGDAYGGLPPADTVPVTSEPVPEEPEIDEPDEPEEPEVPTHPIVVPPERPDRPDRPDHGLPGRPGRPDVGPHPDQELPGTDDTVPGRPQPTQQAAAPRGRPRKPPTIGGH